MSKRIWLWLSLVFLIVSVDAFAQIETWGSNFSGQIGDGTSGTTNDRPSPTTIGRLTDVLRSADLLTALSLKQTERFGVGAGTVTDNSATARRRNASRRFCSGSD